MNERSWAAVDDYLDGLFAPPGDGLDEILATSEATGLPPMSVTPTQGRLLGILAAAVGARRALEVGTLGGYSAVWIARALPVDGWLVTLEIDPHHAEVARRNLAAAGVDRRVDVIVGAAADTLAELEPPFDFVFIDADKASTPVYLDHALRLARPGALIVVDNVVRGGAVLDAEGDAAVQGVRRALGALARDPRLDATALQTVGGKGWDGLAIARVR